MQAVSFTARTDRRKSLAYRATVGGRYDLAVARVGSRQPLFLVPGMTSQCRTPPVWSPDGRWIACGGAGPTVILVSPDGVQRRSLPSPVNPFYGGSRATASGRILMATSRSSFISTARHTVPAWKIEAVRRRNVREPNPALYRQTDR